jgi:hypothetical protein
MYYLKRLLFFYFLVICNFSYSQDILWEKSCGGQHAEFLYDALPTADYGFILAGSSLSNKNGNKQDNSKGDLDYWIWKLNEKGVLEWQKSFGGSGVDLLQSVQNTNDGGFILAGTSTSNSGGDKLENSKGQEDFWILKLDAKGNQLWQKTIGGSGQEKLMSIIQTKEGGYLLGGTSSSNKSALNEKGVPDVYGKTEDSKGGLDYWVVKLDFKGEIKWQKTLGGKYVDELKSIHQTADKGYILGGYSNSPISGDKTQECFGLNDYWVIKLDEKGNQQWQQTFGGPEDDLLFALTPTKDGGYIVGGNSNSEAANSKNVSKQNGTDYWVIKLDANGTISWQKSYDYGSKDVLTSIIESEDGTFLIGGYAQSEQKNSSKTIRKDEEGINDYIALKIKANGEEIWTQTVGSKGDEILKKLFETRDGGYILAGTSKGKASADKTSDNGGSDFWVVKLKDKDKKINPAVLVEAIPNPATTFTNVIVGYAYENGTALLVDLNGRILQEFTLDGNRTLPIDVSNYPEGIYVVTIKTNLQTNSVKIIKGISKN